MDLCKVPSGADSRNCQLRGAQQFLADDAAPSRPDRDLIPLGDTSYGTAQVEVPLSALPGSGGVPGD